LVGNEACDDGNLTVADGCGQNCQVEAGYVCHGTVLSFCEKASCDACEHLQCLGESDMAYLGQGTMPVSELSINEMTARVMTCAYATRCVLEGTSGFNPVTDGGMEFDGTYECLCGGTLPYDQNTWYQCLTGLLHGPCYEVMYLASDAQSFDDVASRYYSWDWAIGRATRLLQCEEESCASDCRR
jgi:cysteine-rich repeat protein